MWIEQWVQWPSAITTVDPPWHWTACYVVSGRVVAMYVKG